MNSQENTGTLLHRFMILLGVLLVVQISTTNQRWPYLNLEQKGLTTHYVGIILIKLVNWEIQCLKADQALSLLIYTSSYEVNK